MATIKNTQFSSSLGGALLIVRAVNYGLRTKRLQLDAIWSMAISSMVCIKCLKGV